MLLEEERIRKSTTMSKYTDEQIKQEVCKTLENPALRKCFQCVHGENCRECQKLHIPISKYQYAGHCQYYITNEELMLLQAKKRMEEIEKDEKKLNHILTISLNCIEVAMLLMEDFESRIEGQYKVAETRGTGDPKVRKNDRQWVAMLKRAYKNMIQHIEGLRRQYTHFFEPQLNKVFFDKETRVYDAASYDDHMSDAHELARIIIKYFEKSYLSFDNANAIERFIESLSGIGVMEESDYKRYNLRR